MAGDMGLYQPLPENLASNDGDWEDEGSHRPHRDGPIVNARRIVRTRDGIVSYEYEIPARERHCRLAVDDKLLVGRGFRFEVTAIDWRAGQGHPNYTVICPHGSSPTGPGWQYLGWPAHTVAATVNGIIAKCEGDCCGNPKNVVSRRGSGVLGVAINDETGLGRYDDNSGSVRVLVLAVYT